ncbi:uncharacterized protein LOC142357985 isoform X2 [Convolutriloba macropyga]|uniref:uncharacterized protein LOC142357985 isoform X2 n=1 Tax=Convolutriloba macropyga TaxID=536237 RepID=UPI003F51DC5A
MPTVNKYSTAKGSTENNSSTRKFVIVNPEPNTKLLKDDIVYLIRPELLTSDDSAYLHLNNESQLMSGSSSFTGQGGGGGQSFIPNGLNTATAPSTASSLNQRPTTQPFQPSLRKESRAMSINSNNGLTPISEDGAATGTDSSCSGLSDTKTMTTTVMDSL